MRFDAAFPALCLRAEVDVIVENLSLLGWAQIANIDNRAAINEHWQIALSEPSPRCLVDVPARRQQKAISVADRGLDFSERRGPILHIFFANDVGAESVIDPEKSAGIMGVPSGVKVAWASQI